MHAPAYLQPSVSNSIEFLVSQSLTANSVDAQARDRDDYHQITYIKLGETKPPQSVRNKQAYLRSVARNTVADLRRERNRDWVSGMFGHDAVRLDHTYVAEPEAPSMERAHEAKEILRYLARTLKPIEWAILCHDVQYGSEAPFGEYTLGAYRRKLSRVREKARALLDERPESMSDRLG